MASGGNDISRIDTSPEKEAHVLYGAVIGGPDKFDQYYDIRSDWPETEVIATSNLVVYADLKDRLPLTITHPC